MDKILFSLTRFHKLAKMIKDRLANVAKVRDVLADLAAGLGVDRSRVRAPLHHVEHHLCHMASAYLVSPVPGGGGSLHRWGLATLWSTMLGRARGDQIEVLERIEFPHSLGIFYTAVTQILGFPKYGDEGKVMGLAPTGSRSTWSRWPSS